MAPDFDFEQSDGSTIVGTLGLRYEFPVQTARFRPYAAGGLGINNTRAVVGGMVIPGGGVEHNSAAKWSNGIATNLGNTFMPPVSIVMS